MSAKRQGHVSKIDQEPRNSKRRKDNDVDLTASRASHVSATKQQETFVDIQDKAVGCDSLRSVEGKLRI